MSEVRATLTADDAGYTETFNKAREAHEAFFESEHRVIESVSRMTREIVSARDPVEGLTGAAEHLAHIFGDEFAVAAVSVVAAVGLIGAKAFESHEQFVKLREDVDGLGTISKFGPEMDVGSASTSLLQSKSDDAKKIIQDQVEYLSDPSLISRLERGWNRVFGFLGHNDDTQAHIKAGRDAFGKEQEVYSELASRTDQQTALTGQAGADKFRGTAQRGEDQKAQIDFDYQTKIAELREKQDEAGAQALERERDMKKGLVDLDTAHAEQVRAEDQRHNEAEAAIIKMRADGRTEDAKEAEAAESGTHQSNLQQINGEAYTGEADVTNAQVAAMKEENQLAQDHLQAELAIAQVVGPRGERDLKIQQMKIDELNRQLSIEQDVTKQMQLRVSIAEAQRALDDAKADRQESIAKLQSEGSYLDIQYGYEKKGGTGEESEEEKVDLAASKMAELMRELESPQVKGDAEKETSIENELKTLRNQVATPINRLDFGGTTQLAVGGGRRGSGGDPLLAETKEQTKFLDSIDKNIAALNTKIQRDSKGGTLK